MLASVFSSLLRLTAKFHPKLGALKITRRPPGLATAVSAEGPDSVGLTLITGEDTSDAVEVGSGGTWAISCSRGVVAYFAKSAAVGDALTSPDEESDAVGIGTAY